MDMVVAMDWTEFDADDHSTPLLWQSVPKHRLKDPCNDHEDALLGRLKEALPEDCRVTLLADRGFCDSKLYSHLKDTLGFDFIIRFRDNILVEDKQGQLKTALQWVGPDGRLRTLREVKVTGERVEVARSVFVRRKDMKEARCLVSALAIALLTLLGMAGEAVGLERTLKANTEKRRTYSLFTQGTIYYGLLPGMKEREAEAMIGKFHELLSKQRVSRELLGIL